MIQRIQTIYLGLALMAFLLIGTFPMVKFENVSNTLYGPSKEVGVFAFKDQLHPSNLKVPGEHIIWHFFSLSIWIIAGILIITSIFLFKNRIWQMRLCWISILFILALSYLIYMDLANFQAYAMEKKLGIGAFSISASILLLLLARKQIDKDEKLVRSVDRIR